MNQNKMIDLKKKFFVLVKTCYTQKSLERGLLESTAKMRWETEHHFDA